MVFWIFKMDEEENSSNAEINSSFLFAGLAGGRFFEKSFFFFAFASIESSACGMRRRKKSWIRKGDFYFVSEIFYNFRNTEAGRVFFSYVNCQILGSEG